jgi:hypothetical protein
MPTLTSPSPIVSGSHSARSALLGGVITGQIAGLIMAIVVMAVFTIFLGHGPLYPVQVIGSAVFGETALQGFHLGAFLAGLLIHQLGPALAYGALFGAAAGVLHTDTRYSALALGLGIGVLSTVIDVYILVPAVFNALHGVDIWNREVPYFWDWAAHIVFGLSFALYPAVLKKLQR